jgi:hypothetical protein
METGQPAQDAGSSRRSRPLRDAGACAAIPRAFLLPASSRVQMLTAPELKPNIPK